MAARVAIIGAGLQASRRVPVIMDDPEYKISWVIDLVEQRAKRVATLCGAKWGTDWRIAVDDRDVKVVLVLTYPNSHAAISIAAMEAGKDVLCEKPLARTDIEARLMVKTARQTKKILKCGFNYRHHPALQEAHRLFKKKIIGKPIFGRSRHGIIGRSGLENEWRSDTKIVSGGQLMEQGIHVVDLFRWFLGEISEVTGFVNANFWPIKPLEDNGFALLKTGDGVIASIHSSLTQWTNLFEFELFGEKGSLCVYGLGGGYGVEKLIITRKDQDGPFAHKTIEFRGGDSSWKKEWEEFTKAIKTRRNPIGDGFDGLRALGIVNAVYKASKSKRAVKLK